MILVDSSVLIDLIERTPEWFEWRAEQLYAAMQRDQVGINAIIFAEVSRSFDSFEAQNAFLQTTGISYLHIPAAAAYAASAAHRVPTVRRVGRGLRHCRIFFIGAHAQVAGHTLMTRDAKRMLTYFPHVPVLSPR